MSWSRTAILLAFAAATVAGLVCFERPSQLQPGAISTVACYIALANDLTPLLRSGAPDAAAAGPECTEQPAIEAGRHRDMHVVAPRVDSGKAAKTTPASSDGARSSAAPLHVRSPD